MKIKLSQLVNSADALSRLCNQETSGRLAYSLSKVMKAAQAELQSFDEARTSLIKKHGEEKEGAFSVAPDDEHWPDFVKEYEELAETETTLAIEPISPDALDGVKISASDASLLDWLIAEV